MRIPVTTIALSLFLIGAPPALAGWDEGVAAFTSKNFQGAVAEFQGLVEQNPEDWRGHYMLGLSLEQLRRHEEALEHLHKAYDLNPNDLNIMLSLGRAYKTARRYGDVAKLLGSVDASSLPVQQRAVFYQMRGEARHKSGDAANALNDFEQLARLQPDNVRNQYFYATAALAAGQTDAGIGALAKALQLAPGNGDISRMYIRALSIKGRTSRDKETRQQSYLLAAKVAGELVDKDASEENLILKLSAELGAGVYSRAIETGNAVVAKSTSDWLAQLYLGQAYTGNGQYQEAVEPLIQAKSLATEPDDLKTVWRQLGFVYEKQKMYAQSIDAYQNAGDQGAVARVKENESTDRFNNSVEQQNAEIENMRKEAEALEAELKALEQGGGG